MASLRLIYASAVMGSFLPIAGCGLGVPDIKEVWDGPYGTEQIEFEIKKHVYCELKEAVNSAEKIPFFVEDRSTGRKTHIPIIPPSWGAQVSLLLQVDESASFNPGASLTSPLRNSVSSFSNGNVTTPQSFSLGLGVTSSSTATRIDKFDPYYSVSYLLIPKTKDSVCIAANDPFLLNKDVPSTSSPLIVGDLGLVKWLNDAMFTNAALHSIEPGKSTNKDTPDTISIEIKFVIVTSGNINPVWKLARVTSNSGSVPLLSTGRTRTHDLLITIGPANEKTANSHLASQIGQIVNSNRANSVGQ